MDKGFYLPIRIACAVLFCLFSLVYFYVYQADVMAVAQRVASGGKTHYEPVAGALLITVALQLLQWAVYGLTRLYKRYHALTYVPSFLAMLFLVSIPDGHLRHWLWVAPLMLVVWGVTVWVRHGRQAIEEKEPSAGLASRAMLRNLLMLLLMMVAVAWIGGKTEAEYQTAHTERVLTDNVRAFTAQRDTITNPRQKEADSELIALLMQKRVHEFVRLLPRYYDVSQPLPRCYAEALVLNMSLTHHPQVFWRGSYDGQPLQETFQDFQREQAAVEQAQKEQAPSQAFQLYEAFRKKYRDTYWYFFNL